MGGLFKKELSQCGTVQFEMIQYCYIFINGLSDMDRYSIHRQTENSYPMKVSYIVLYQMLECKTVLKRACIMLVSGFYSLRDYSEVKRM